jgi:hypothetical protein
MKRKSKAEQNGMVGVELKYCEHCGGLWVREKGTGVVYCDKCRAKVEDLPVRKKKPARISVPGERPSSVAEKYGSESRRRDFRQSSFDPDDDDMEAMGGVA